MKDKSLKIALGIAVFAAVALFAGKVFAGQPGTKPPVLVPEPISSSLLLLGSAAMGVRAYIKRKK